MAPKSKPKSTTPQHPRAHRGTQAPRKPGAKKRSARVIAGKTTRASARVDPNAFWAPALHRKPPPLRTSFGNFSTLNLVSRFNISTSLTAENDRVLIIPFTATPLASMHVLHVNGTQNIFQNVFGPLSTAFPLATRPLRMSVEIKNLTTAVNVAGLVQVLSVDNALELGATLGINANSIVVADNASWLSVKNTVAGSTETKTFTGSELTAGHTWVSCPSSWPAYNSYRDFIPFLNVGNNSAMSSQDWESLSTGQYPPAVYVQPTGVVELDNTIGDVPAMRAFVLVFKATTNATQDYEITIRRQDGARYQANTLGHMFHATTNNGTVSQETQMINAANEKSQNPSQPVLSNILNTAGNAVRTALQREMQIFTTANKFLGGFRSGGFKM